MKLIKVTCEVRFAESMKMLGSYEALHRELIKEEPKNVERWLMPGMKLRDKDRRRIMVIDSSRSIVDVEQPSNMGNCKDLIVQFFRMVDKEFKIPKVIRWGIRSTWIEKYEGKFSDLLLAYKKNMFNSAIMAKKADDVGIVLDYYLEEKTKLAITTGPMEIAQLKNQFLAFEPVDVPPVFIYADIDMSDTKPQKFSVEYLGKFLFRAIKEGEKLALEVTKCIGSGK